MGRTFQEQLGDDCEYHRDRYRHTSGCTAIAEFTFTSAGDFVDVYAVNDPRLYEGHPFEVRQRVERVLERRDPNGPYSPDNAVEIAIPGAYYADRLRLSKATFDAEWVSV